MKFAVSLLILINLNTATVEELDELPGIGPVIARRIVEFREKRGGCRSVVELLAIQGISERRWQELRKLVEVRDPGSYRPRSPSRRSDRMRSPRENLRRNEWTGQYAVGTVP